MNHLDRAFIKADRKRKAERTTAPRHGTAAFGPSTATSGETQFVREGSAAVSYSATSLADPPQPLPPAPHISTNALRVVQVAEALANTATDATANAAVRFQSAVSAPVAEAPAVVVEPAPVYRFDAAVPQIAAPHISTFIAPATTSLSNAREVIAPLADAPPQLVDPIRPLAPSNPAKPAPTAPVPAVASVPVAAAQPAPANKPVHVPLAAVNDTPSGRLHPLFEVDRLPWPQMCQSLARAASDEFEQVAEDILARSRWGEKLILVTSQCRGEGGTTVALCLTRLLAARNVNVALVDGDFARGQLVRQLKLLPQAGWEQVLRGEIPLDEALVESMEDHVVVLPLQGPINEKQLQAGSAQIAHSLERMREEFDVVLVDAAPLEDRSASLSKLLAAARFQSAIVVQDVRANHAGELDQLLLQLRSIPRVEIAKNFVSAA